MCGRSLGLATRLGFSCLALIVAFIVAGLVAPCAGASSIQDTQYIGELRSIFGIDSSQASDAQLAQLLDASQLGPSIRGDLDCAFVGEHALDSTGVEQAEVSALSSEIDSVLAADQLADPLILSVLGDTASAELITGLHSSLGQFKSLLSTYVDTVAYLDSDNAYRSLLAQYYGDEVDDGQSAEEAQQDLKENFGPALSAAAQPRGLSTPQLFAQFEYASGCMRLVQDTGDRLGYADYIDGVVRSVSAYQGGTGLVLVPVSGNAMQAVDTGDAMVTDLSIRDSGGHTLGQLSELDPGEDALLSLSSGTVTDASTVGFTVDGVAGLSTAYAGVRRDLFVGDATALLAGSPPMTANFGIDQGPFAAAGSSPSYSWAFSDGGGAPGVAVTHSFACPGDQTATFTATAGGQTVTRRAGVTLPPPYTADWTTSTGEYAVAPGVQLGFNADPSIASNTNLSVTWSFGDGTNASGASVTHTFSSAAVENVTMYVTQRSSSCPALTQSHQVTVGRSDQWVPISGTIGNYTMTSTVAGYVLEGPVYVAKGRTLTVEPGANVKFVRAAGEGGELLVNGSLVAPGPVGTPAVFTSEYDDTAGGHCSCAPTGHSPAAGDWYGIVAEPGGTVNLNGAEVRYGNWGVSIQEAPATLKITSSTFLDDGDGVETTGVNSVAVDRSTFASDGTGVRIDCFGCSYAPRVTNSVFTGDQVGVWATGNAAPAIDHATFDGVNQEAVLDSTAARTALTHTTVQDGGGYVQLGEGVLPAGVVHLVSDLPYAFDGNVAVSPKTVLVIGPGTTIKFLSIGSPGVDPGELSVSGTLVASGTAAAPAIFTSPYDDAAGGHCGCAKAGVTPAAGDWYGIQVEGGGSATLDHAVVRYARDDVELPGTGSRAQIENTTLSNAGAGLAVRAANTVAVGSSSLSQDGTGLQLDCFACAYTANVTDTSFDADSTGVGLTGNASAAIHASDFDPQDAWGIYNAGNATVDATGNWWGAASGPKPLGLGTRVAGNVLFQPFCAGAQCTSVALTASSAVLAANGRATTTITATVSRPTGPVPGEHVSFSSTDTSERLGPVTDNGDGTYTMTLTASHAVGAATITATDGSLDPAPSASIVVTQAAPTVALSLQPASIPADGKATTTATATITGPSGPVAGDNVVFVSSDPDQTIGAVTDNGDGTYTATITASHAPGFVIVTAMDDSVSPTVSASADLVQTPPIAVSMALSPDTIAANGRATTTATVTVLAAGAPLSGEHVTLASSDAGESVGSVTDNGDGTYTTTITASHSVGAATITATDESAPSSASATATLDQVAPEISVGLSPAAIAANGRATTTATVTVTGPQGPLTGEPVALAGSDAGESISAVRDNGDGTYTATITASKTTGTATITATDDASAPSASATASLDQVAPKISVGLGPDTIAANGRATTTATVAVSAAGVPLSGEHVTLASSDAGESIGRVTDNGDGTYTATITASKTAGSATITAEDDTVDPPGVATTRLTQASPIVSVSMSPSTIAADGKATTTATVTVTGPQGPLSGESVTLASSDAGESIGSVADNGDGTYTATITASKTVGTAIITATDTSVDPAASATTPLGQAIPRDVHIALSPKSLPADGQSTTTATVTITAHGTPLSGEHISVSSSDPGESISAVTDNGDGTYTATVTASRTVGTATITATDISVSPAASKDVKLKQT